MPFTLIKTPHETEIAWAEHGERARIRRAYLAARDPQAATAARWDAIAHDRANPGSSSLVAELDSHDQAA